MTKRCPREHCNGWLYPDSERGQICGLCGRAVEVAKPEPLPLTREPWHLVKRGRPKKERVLEG